MLVSPKLYSVAEMLTIYGDLRGLFLIYFLSGVWVPEFVEEKSSLVWNTISHSEGFDWTMSSANLVSIDKLTDRDPSFLVEDEKDKKEPSSSNKASMLAKLLEKNPNSAALLMACAFPYFIRSKEYSSFLNKDDVEHKKIIKEFQETGYSMRTRRDSIDSETSTERSSQSLNIQIHGRTISTHNMHGATFSSPSFSNHCINGSRLQSLLTNRLAKCRQADLFLQLANTSNVWLENFLRFTLDLPYAISVAKVTDSYYTRESSKKAIGSHMPIVYVNHAYEELMQFPNSDLEGFAINCLFDATVAGESAVDAFENSLEEMKPIQTLMKMERRSGEVVDTWLATCPVYSSSMKAYTHVIVMQYIMPDHRPDNLMSDAKEDMEQLLCLLSGALY